MSIKESVKRVFLYRLFGKSYLHEILASAVFLVVVGMGILARLCFRPREYTEAGLVVALMLIPGVTGLGPLAILQLIW